MNATAIWALVRADLRLFFRDRRALLVTFATPIALASFFGFIMGGPKDKKPTPVKVVLVDEDGSERSRAIADSVAKQETLAVERLEEAEKAIERVRAGDAVVAVVLPVAGASERPPLRLLYDPSKTTELGLVRGLVMRAAMEALAPPGEKATLPFTPTEEEVTAKEGAKYNGFAHSFAGMGVQFALFAALDGGINILNDRQRGLWKRLRAAPLSRASLLLAKILSGAIIAALALLVLFLFARVVFDVRVEGSFLGMVLVCVSFALFAAATGLFVAAVGKTAAATRGIGIFVLLVAVMLGGAWVPSFLFPGWLQKVTLVAPTRWAVDGLDLMTWRGQGLAVGLIHAGVLLAFAVLFGVLAWWRFRWEE